jgi:hypothetical protein
MKKLLHVGLLSVVIIVGLSCGDSTGSGAGELKVRLTTPNSGADSAIVLTITGPAGSTLTKATAGTGLRLFQPPLTGRTTRFALIGQLTQGAVILTIGVPDVNAVSQYSGMVEGVSQPDYQLRTSLAGYALAITR